MDCARVREIIPGYIRHTLLAEESVSIEEHLCVCNDCRNFLAKTMDELEDKPQEAPKTPSISTGASINIDDSEFNVVSHKEGEAKANTAEASQSDSKNVIGPESSQNKKEEPVSKQPPEPSIIEKIPPAKPSGHKICLLDLIGIAIALIVVVFLLFLIIR